MVSKYGAFQFGIESMRRPTLFEIASLWCFRGKQYTNSAKIFTIVYLQFKCLAEDSFYSLKV